MELPGINRRIKELINEETFGKVRPFAELIGFQQPQKLNRLFKPDSRNGEYPIPSTDIILAIVDKFSDLNIEWLLKGKGKQKKDALQNTQSEDNVELTESDIMKVIEVIYLHENELMENKLFMNWLSKKQAEAENRILKKIKAIKDD
ncbi:hypothetical protein [Aquimarina algiphila]|uniref:Bacteriophage CI repressor n=1 Tax=Aquimarina algiphila TaxID=2047982 RepID=A0A554VA43_9FLAO|nr:hypothetical protein [Aquimarina algiphila]TSE02678.1 hypothetical protein FOF46_30640 [Aquimarina algiphila]